MTSSEKRIVRCSSCRLHFETDAARPLCRACGRPIDGEDAAEADAAEKTPTQPNEIIRLDK